MRRCVEALAAAVVATVAMTAAAGAGAEGVPRLDGREALVASQAVVGTVPPDFTLLDRDEQPVRLADLRGRPLLVSFIYTGCFTECPAQTRMLHQAVNGLDRMLGPDQFTVVSIGFNQPADSPQAMKAFAAQHRIDYPNWRFLSPHARHVEALTRAYGFSLVQTPAGYDHVVEVTVVDAEGRIHAQVYGTGVTAQALGEPLRQLILSAPVSGALPTLDELIDRVRILCTVYDPDTGEYRYDWSLLIQVVGGIGFFLTVAVYLWRERRSQRSARERDRLGAAH